jgi:hypothetical protein
VTVTALQTGEVELGQAGQQPCLIPIHLHPRAAIKFKEAELKGEKGDILKFHDTVTDQK